MNDETPGHDPEQLPDPRIAGMAALDLVSYLIDTLRENGILREDELLSMLKEAQKDSLESEGDQRDRERHKVYALLLGGVKP